MNIKPNVVCHLRSIHKDGTTSIVGTAEWRASGSILVDGRSILVHLEFLVFRENFDDQFQGIIQREGVHSEKAGKNVAITPANAL